MIAVRATQNFYAHSHPDLQMAEWHRLKDHLEGVGSLSGTFATKLSAEAFGRTAGLLHDVGKYSDAFQARLRGDVRRVDHSTAGAQIATRSYGTLGRIIASAIAGHHAGLANGTGTGERTPLEERLSTAVADLAPAWRTEITLVEQLQPPKLKGHPGDRDRTAFGLSFFTRMVFSCLVDADYLDTEAFFSRAEGGRKARGVWPDLGELRQSLNRTLREITAAAAPSDVNTLRAAILTAARDAAACSPGLFSLAVPTGGGKTLASLAFALDHANLHGLDRVIYVAPFTSVIEQNAEVFRRALNPHGDAVIEHHSAFRDDAVLAALRERGGEKGPEARDKLRLAMENWDAPIVTTTAVQFFESLFAATPAKCRKLHNIARSVVILDEAQTLPLRLLRPCVAALDELARNYRATIVLCTATQPALEETDDPERSFRGGFRGVREIAPEPPRLYRMLKRVTVSHIGDADDERLTTELAQRDRVLCIVNSRAHARSLYQAISDHPGSLHLSTSMCAAHRAEALKTIRTALKQGEPCRVVATSLIEAGVDVDFPCVFRAEAGLDAIAQAAGRCNREGFQRPEQAPVFVFKAVGWATPHELDQFATATRSVLRVHGADPISLDAIEAYFRELYWFKESGRHDGLDKNNIIGRLAAGARDALFPFEDIARDFRMIESNMQPIIVPHDQNARNLISRLPFATRVGSIMRKLQPYVVPVPQRAFEALRAAAAVRPVGDDPLGEQFCVLHNQSLYRDDIGLMWDDPDFHDAEGLII
ncbi:MAG: CRISPR-associated endonuclease Cas3'' [Rhodospirillales bacterium]|nr:CRISPR-associated endonuclease Cas3'' [Rhodospirillales bacterium]